MRKLICCFAACILSIALLLVPSASAQVSTGIPPLGSFSSGPDVTNLGNLNSNLRFPVVHKPGRGMPFDFILSYDTSVWTPVTANGVTSWQPVGNWGWRTLTEANVGYISYRSTRIECQVLIADTEPHLIPTVDLPVATKMLRIAHVGLYLKVAAEIGCRGKFPMNIDRLQNQAESGNVAAQAILGMCYLEGINVKSDYNMAFQFLSSAAANGSPRAAAGLGRMYAQGLATPRDPERAIRFYEQAAQAGEFFAQIELARLYLHDDEIGVDHKSAFKWYSAAAKQESMIGHCPELLEAQQYIEKYSEGS